MEILSKLENWENTQVDQEFVKDHCENIVKGMEKLCSWVKWWKNSQ